MREFQLMHDSNTLLLVNYSDGKVEGLSVIVYIGGIDYEVTKALPQGLLKYLREWAETEIGEIYGEF